MIVETTRAILLRLLASNYNVLKRRLTYRLRSEDLASEVLHETYLRLGRMAEAGAVEQPAAYVYRTALNVAAELRRVEIRRLTKLEADAITREQDDTFDPERIAAGRREIETLADALDELPPRRREIFLAARLDEVTTEVLAKRLGLSTSTVERELRRAFDHCIERLNKKK